MKGSVLKKNSVPNDFIIPAIDIIEGKCVRLTRGDFSQKKIYNENPVEIARQFEDAGCGRLHLVDLDGARSGMVTNWKVLESIARNTNLQIDFGGGLKTLQDVDVVFSSGAKWATIGSMAVEEEELFSQLLAKFGAEKFLLGADVKDEMIAIRGWQETSAISIFDFLRKYEAKGVHNIFCTDVAKDGMLEGPGIEIYKKIIKEFPNVDLVASGGVRSVDDIHILVKIGCKGAIVGKAIYEGRIRMNDLASINKSS